MGGGADAGGLVHGDGDVIALRRRPGDPGVQAHAHPHFAALGPVLRGQAALAVEAGADGLPGVAKGGEHAVAFGVDLDAVVGGDGGPQQPPVRLEDAS